MVWVFSEQGAEDFSHLELPMRRLFRAHMEKPLHMPARKHLRFGLPFFCEKVTAQARLVFRMEGENLRAVRCFATHKEYEKWFRGIK